MKYHNVGIQWGPYEQRSLLLYRQPWWTHLIDSFVSSVCSLSGHRWCNSALSNWAIRLGDRHMETFTVPVDRDLLSAYCQWSGEWNLDTDDEDESETLES